MASLASAIVPSFHQYEAKNLTQDEAHANILKNHPAEWIIESENIDKYLLANRGKYYTKFI